MGANLTIAASEGVATAASIEFLEEPRGSLGAAMDALRRGVTVTPPPVLLDEARRHLSAVRPQCQRASDERIIGWLTKLASGVAGAPRSDELRSRLDALIEACRELPVGVWVPETRKAYWQSHTFWPQPHDLFGHLKPYAVMLDRHKAGAEAVIRAAGGEEVSPYVQPTQAERDAVAATWRARKAKIEADREVAVRGVDRQPVTASPISDEVLLAIHEKAAAEGAPGSALRAHHLRLKIEREHGRA